MSKAVKLSKAQWIKLENKLTSSHPLSVMIIRSKMRKVLGFTPREHQAWTYDGDDSRGMYQTFVYLDFFDDLKQTMFCLKYSDYIQNENEDYSTPLVI
jgi:hypothetical protein